MTFLVDKIREADEMTCEMEEYVETIEESITKHLGDSKIKEWKLEMDAWERDIVDFRKHDGLKVPFEMPAEAGSPCQYCSLTRLTHYRAHHCADCGTTQTREEC